MPTGQPAKTVNQPAKTTPPTSNPPQTAGQPGAQTAMPTKEATAVNGIVLRRTGAQTIMPTKTHPAPKTPPNAGQTKAKGMVITKASSNPGLPQNAGKPVLIDSLPMTRYSFVVRGRLSSGAETVIRGIVHARKGLYYQARARVLDSVLKEIPTLVLDEDGPVGLKMHAPRRCLPPQDPSRLERSRPPRP
ncbi:MAG: hypothetical protein LBI02_00405 [Opitutaceae bacterium]|jgi:hypothetical protein|nr:hypothetical protein [Opitutaceae bacterium]